MPCFACCGNTSTRSYDGNCGVDVTLQPVTSFWRRTSNQGQGHAFFALRAATEVWLMAMDHVHTQGRCLRMLWLVNRQPAPSHVTREVTRHARPGSYLGLLSWKTAACTACKPDGMQDQT